MMDFVSITGRVTVNNSDEMRRKLRAALRSKPVQLTVDLSGVAYMDTSGVATLLEAVHSARRQGSRMVLVGLEGQPRYLLETSHIDDLFDAAAPEISA